MKSLFSKIFFGYLAIVVVVITAITYYSLGIINNNYRDKSIEDLKDVSTTLSEQYKSLLIDSNYVQLDKTVKQTGTLLGKRVTVISSNGYVFADSKVDYKNMENHNDRPEFINAIKNGFGISIRYSHSTEKNTLYVAKVIKNGSNTLGVCRVSVYMQDYEKFVNKIKAKILVLVLILIFITLILAYLHSKSITQPIKKLITMTKAVGEGNFLLRAKFKRNDELKKLGESFNDMVEKMELQLENVNNQTHKINNLLKSLQQAIVLFDYNGIIVLSNDKFKELTSLKYYTGKYYWELIKDIDFHKIMKAMLHNSEKETMELNINNSSFICEAIRLQTSNEILVLFYDITELKRLENVKKDFLINVSHELRTPLTVIKGYVETIEELSAEPTLRYISIIKNHTERLISIVNDLLSLSSLEGRYNPLEKSQINIEKFLQNITLSFEQRLKQKNLQLKTCISDEIQTFPADEFKMEQVFINLVDNALKYTESGEIKINVCSEAGLIKFEVVDTGVGIPKEDLDRIFERLYTVDKSRSRQLGGTGLGLSIVKHIVMLHNGKIYADSEINKGSKFTLLLPLD